MTNKQRFSTTQLKQITLFGYFSLLIFMPVWLIFITEDRALSIPLTLVMFTLPLLFPLKGLVQGNPYTYAWSNFIVMIYFLHSLTTLWVSANEKHWALLEFTFAAIMFIAGSYYAKYRGQELGLSIRKKKE
jgi:uncharacterized membrane protein